MKGHAFLVAQMVKNPAAKQEARIPTLGLEDPLEKEMATHSSILAWKTPGQRSLVGYSPCGRRESAMTEVATTFTFFHERTYHP